MLPGQAESERRACARPDLSMHYDVDGRFQLRYSAPAPIGALVEQALKEAKDALFLDASGPREGEATGADQTDSHGIAASDRPTYADALEELAQRSLSSVTSTGRASHYRVYLHLSTDGAWVNGGGALPRRLIDHFVSDGVVQPVWETEGRPVSVGRSMRILPRRSRRLIEDRDRGCRFPGCTASRFVEIHHLHEWAAGGATDVDNQVSLCPFHHDAIDRGDFTIAGDPTRPDGLLVTNRYGVRVRPPTRPSSPPHPAATRPLHPEPRHTNPRAANAHAGTTSRSFPTASGTGSRNSTSSSPLTAPRPQVMTRGRRPVLRTTSWSRSSTAPGTNQLAARRDQIALTCR